MAAPLKIETEPLTPELWPQFEALFESAGGVCGGCWCYVLAAREGGELRGAQGQAGEGTHQAADHERSGARHPRTRLGRTRGLVLLRPPHRLPQARPRAVHRTHPRRGEGVVLPCFFVKSGFRRRGVAAVLLAAARKEIAKLAKRGEVVEGYPESPEGLPGVHLHRNRLPLRETGVHARAAPAEGAPADARPGSPVGPPRRGRWALRSIPGLRGRAPPSDARKPWRVGARRERYLADACLAVDPGPPEATAGEDGFFVAVVGTDGARAWSAELEAAEVRRQLADFGTLAFLIPADRLPPASYRLTIRRSSAAGMARPFLEVPFTVVRRG